MRIFGPLPWPTISPVTVTLARAAASLVTVSPSTSRIAGRVTVSPASPVRRFTVNRSPTATLCWLPPAFTTAYTTDSSQLATLSCPVRTPRVVHRSRTGPARPPGGHARCARRWHATRPAYLTPDGPAAGSRREGASGGGSEALPGTPGTPIPRADPPGGWPHGGGAGAGPRPPPPGPRRSPPRRSRPPSHRAARRSPRRPPAAPRSPPAPRSPLAPRFPAPRSRPAPRRPPAPRPPAPRPPAPR